MPGNWHRHDAGLIQLELPPGWLSDQPSAGTLLLLDPDTGISTALVAVSKEAHAPGTTARATAPVEAQFELQKWINSQKLVQVNQAPRILTGTAYPTATTEGLQQLRPIGPWYKRLLRGWRQHLTLWRYWAVINPHLVVLVSSHGRPAAVEQQRKLLDRLIASIQLPERDILTGRRFTEMVVSLARSWFPQTQVAVIDDVHVQFGPRNVPLHNLLRSYLASPEELPTQVRELLTEIQVDLPASAVAGTWNHAKEHVMPVFLTRETLNNVLGRVAHEDWINDLFIAYVLEDASADAGKAPEQRLITLDDLARWSIEQDVMHEQALQNLIIYSHEQIMEGRKEEGCTILCLARPDRHNATRILLPELHHKLREHLGATFYAAMPTREMLLAFKTTDEIILAKLRHEVERDFKHSTSGLSPKLFLVTSDGIAGDPELGA